MKARSLFRFALIVVVSFTASGAFAQGNNPLITVFEDGTGSLLFPGGSPIVTTGVLAPDPGPGGLSLALTFNLLGPPGLVAGDLNVFENLSENLGDVIRFNPAGTGSAGYPASLVFYSAAGGGLLGDTGLPTGAYTNVVFNSESGSEDLFYTPTANQPGFVPGFSVTYHIISGASSVPESGTTITLLGLGMAGIAFIRRKLIA